MHGRNENLPTLNYIWVGPPKLDNSGKLIGNDFEDVVDMSRRCSNPVCYYCLDSYVKYYDELFKIQGCNVAVKSIDTYLHEMSIDDNQDQDIHRYAVQMMAMREELLQEPRDRIVDRVTFKDAFSLFLLACEGGYTLDTGVKLSADKSDYSFPAYENFKAPWSDDIIECWMMYAAPDKLQQAKLILDNYLTQWDSIQNLIRGYERDIYKIPNFHVAITSLVIDSIKLGLTSIHDNNLLDWKFERLRRDGESASQFENKLSRLNVTKILRNTHKPQLEIRAIISKDINEYIQKTHHIDNSKRNTIIKNLEEQLEYLGKLNIDSLSIIGALNNKLYLVFRAFEELDLSHQQLSTTTDQRADTMNDYLNQAYDKLNQCLINDKSGNDAQMIIEEFRKKTGKTSSEFKKHLDEIFLNKAHSQLSSKSDSDLDKQGDLGKTLLHYAVGSGKPEMVKALLQRHANPNIQDHRSRTPLHQAVQFGKRDMVVALFFKKGVTNPDIKDYDGMTPLHLAVKSKKINIVNSLLKRFANPNIQDNLGMTSLHHAVQSARLDVIKVLLKKGANPNIKDNYGRTPLHYVVNSDMVAALLERAANSDIKDNHGRTPLQHAVSSANLDMLNALLDGGVDPNSLNKNNNSLLHDVVQYGRLDMVEVLLEKGAKPDIKDNHGMTALHYAVASGKLDKVQSLLKNNATLDIKDNEGMTPLHYAVDSRNIHIINALLQQGADPNIQDNKGKTPLHHAVKSGKLDIVQVLINKGARPHIVDKKGITPLALTRNKEKLLNVLNTKPDMQNKIFNSNMSIFNHPHGQDNEKSKINKLTDEKQPTTTSTKTNKST